MGKLIHESVVTHFFLQKRKEKEKETLLRYWILLNMCKHWRKKALLFVYVHQVNNFKRFPLIEILLYIFYFLKFYIHYYKIN
jgi:hypothetical protein